VLSASPGRQRGRGAAGVVAAVAWAAAGGGGDERVLADVRAGGATGGGAAGDGASLAGEGDRVGAADLTEKRWESIISGIRLLLRV
jgi:hypothetical protein